MNEVPAEIWTEVLLANNYLKTGNLPLRLPSIPEIL